MAAKKKAARPTVAKSGKSSSKSVGTAAGPVKKAAKKSKKPAASANSGAGPKRTAKALEPAAPSPAAPSPAAPAPAAKTIPLARRSEVPVGDTWDLASLFADDAAWETSFAAWKKRFPEYERFKGRLGFSATLLAECLEFDLEVDRLGERLGNYAYLKTAEDTANSAYQAMLGHYRHAAVEVSQVSSFIRPEIMAIPADRMRDFLFAPSLQPHRLSLERLLRHKPHTLTDREEKLLAMQGEMASTAGIVFRQLNNADLKFGYVRNEKGEQIELSHASFSTCLHAPSRAVRSGAFHQYYAQFAAHENTLAASLAGSIQRDIYYAKVRNFPGALAEALFADNVPQSVYDSLIASVHARLPALYDYFEIRRRAMQLDDIHHYDTYVPILSDLEVHRTWEEAVELVLESLAPLGEEYGDALAQGLRGRWCDRYENAGKQSGAFSSGSFDGDPYILMNYQPQVLDHVFTLTHEAGHSMHSYYSARNQPYQYYQYTIFVAEVASTFNEQLLSKFLMDRARSDQERAFYINREIDAIRGTIIRQTMFAEFEKITHALAEGGEPLTVDRFKQVYRELLETYFGPKFALDDCLSLECFRIPHFYRAFYVYKYATGLSAAIALAERVLSGGQQELHDYLRFLKSGCSKWPIDLLKDAGVDMSTPLPVDTALARFERLVQELGTLV